MRIILFIKILLLFFALSAEAQSYSFSASGLPVATGWASPCTLNVNVSGITMNGGVLAAGSLVLKQVNIALGDGANETFNNYYVDILAPDGITKFRVLFNGNGSGVGIQGIDTRIRDNPQLVEIRNMSGQSQGAPYRVGYYKTYESFSTVNGQNVNGTWKAIFNRTSGVRKAITKLDLIFGAPFDVTNVTGAGFSYYDQCATAQCIDEDHIFVGTNNLFTNDPADPYAGTNNSTYAPGACQWNGAKNNSAWYTFVANSTSTTVSISGLTDLVQMIGLHGPSCATTEDGWRNRLLTGGCPTDPANDDYYSGRYTGTSGSRWNQQLNLSGLTVGSRYYILIDGNGGAISPYYIELTNGYTCCPIEVTITPTNPLCAGGFGSATATVTGQVAPIGNEVITWSSGQSGPVSSNLTAVNLPAGVITATVTDPDYPTCHSEGTATITDPTLFTVNASVITSPICPKESTNLFATPLNGSGTVNYTWDNASTLNNAAIQNPVATPIASTLYTVTATDNNSCIATSSVQVNLKTPPSPVASNNSPICQGQTLNLYCDISGATYSWTGPSGLVISTAQNPIIPAAMTSNSGTYTVTVTQNGCTGSATTIATVTPGLTPTVTSNSPVCKGQDLNLFCNVSGGSYVWSGPVVVSPIQNPVINAVTPAVAGTYTVTATLNGCSGTGSTVVSLNPDPVPVAGNNGPLCTGETLNLTCDISGGTYVWSGPGFNSTAQNPVISSVSLAANGTYTVTVTINGCTGTASTTVIVNSNLTPKLTSNSPICEGNTLNILCDIAGGTYSWTGPDNFVFSGQNPSILSAKPSATGTYNLSVTNANNCSGTASIDVVVYPNPIADAGTDQIICSGQSANLTAYGGVTYLWSTNSTSQSINVSPLSNTVYVVTVTDNHQCWDTDDVLVSVNPLPSAVAGADIRICTDSSTTLNASGGLNYVWSPSVGLSNPNIANPLASPTTSTTYTVTVSDINGCEDTDDILITIVSPPVANAGKDTGVCIGNSVNLLAGLGVKYVWSPAAGLSDPNIPNPVASPLVPTTYTVTVSNDIGCIGTDDVFVDVSPIPTAAFIADTLNGCEPLTVVFTDQSTPSIKSWNWDFGDPQSGIGNSSVLNNPQHAYTNDGIYTVTLTVTSGNGCSNTLIKNNMIEVYAKPHVYFDFYPKVGSIFEPKVSFSDMSTNASSWHWNFGDTASSENSSNDKNPEHVYGSIGRYLVTLVVTSVNGCVDSSRRIVPINPEFTFYVPNAFTPNGNGRNDFFFPKGSGIDFNNYEMIIFNRWGEQIFKTNDINIGWDGRVKNGEEICKSDIYIWVVNVKDYSGKLHYLTGIVALIR